MAASLTNLTWAAWGLGLMSCALLAAVVTLAAAVTRLQDRVAFLEDEPDWDVPGWDLPGRDW